MEAEAGGIKVGNAIKLDSSVRASREGFPVLGSFGTRGAERWRERERERSVSDLILDLKACDLIGPPARERARRPLGASSQGKTTNCISETFLSSLG